MSVIPKEEPKPKKEGASLSFWADANLASELRKISDSEGLALSKLVVHLLRAGLKQYVDEKEKELVAASKKKR